MGVEEALRNAIQTAVDWAEHALPSQLAWLTAPARRTLEYVFAPLLDHGGRYPLWGLVAAICIAGFVYLFGGDRAGPRRVRGFLRFCFPPELYRAKSTWVDLKIGVSNYVLFGGGAINLTWRLTTALFASWITHLLTAAAGPSGYHVTWGTVSIVLFMIALSLTDDLGYFLFHWASHVFKPLWAIHKLHHSAEIMTPLTAARVHALERPILGPFKALTTGVLVGPLLYIFAGETGVPTIFALDMAGVLFFMLGHVLHHSHIWVYFGPIIGRVIVSPAQHQIHHSCLPRHLDKNFAEHWAIWDTLFGTLYLPKGRETLKLGLAGYDVQPHPGVVVANVRPVAESITAVYAIGRGWMAKRSQSNAPVNSFSPVLTSEHTTDAG